MEAFKFALNSFDIVSFTRVAHALIRRSHVKRSFINSCVILFKIHS